jgi:beta-glucosidase
VGPWFQKFQSNYIDVSNEPVYPFGYGLSYTSFMYSDVKLDKPSMTQAETLTVSVDVTNTGKYDGAEVVQLYIRDWVGSVTRPVKELKGFKKVMIKAGETQTVTFQLTKEELSFYNYELKWGAEPGEFSVFVGGNSRDVKEAKFTLQ